MRRVVLLLLVLPALVPAAPAAGQAGGVGCTRDGVQKLVRSFVRSYNSGDSQNLERIWAQEPDFHWYFVQKERLGSDSENRLTLGAYFSERHLLGDEMRLRYLRVGPPNPEGQYGIAFKLKRVSEQRAARGRWHGKGSATSVATLPDPYDPLSLQRCVLVVWSMGRD